MKLAVGIYGLRMAARDSGSAVCRYSRYEGKMLPPKTERVEDLPTTMGPGRYRTGSTYW